MGEDVEPWRRVGALGGRAGFRQERVGEVSDDAGRVGEDLEKGAIEPVVGGSVCASERETCQDDDGVVPGAGLEGLRGGLAPSRQSPFSVGGAARAFDVVGQGSEQRLLLRHARRRSSLLRANLPRSSRRLRVTQHARSHGCDGL